MLRRRSLCRPFIVACVVLLVSAFPVAAAPVQLATSNVYRFADGSQVDGAWAILIRNDHGVSMALHTSDLEPGAAYTVWWVVFNNPTACTHGEGDLLCGAGDLPPFGGDPAVMSSVLFAAGHVIGQNGKGTFASHLNVGDLSGEVLFGPGLVYPRTAEIHLVVRTHGQPIPGRVAEQIQTFAGGCDVNVCEDQQFAAFLAP